MIVLLFTMGSKQLFAQNEKESKKLGGWIDAQYRFEDNSKEQNSVIQIRRARLDYRGTWSDKLEYRLQADFASSPRLIDAYMKLNFNKYAQLQVGQFKIPFSLENKLSPLELELTENSQIISALSGYKDVTGISSYANGREIGAMITGKFANVEVRGESMPLVRYGVGLFGGNGINVKNDNMAKDIAARIEICPFVSGLTVSASGYWGRYEMIYNSTATDMDGKRNRFACGAEYTDKHWMVRAEYLKGKTEFVDYDDNASIYNSYIMETQGCYLATRYWFFYNQKNEGAFQQKISPIIRVEYYEKEAGASSMFYSTGVEWWPEQHLRFQLAYTAQQKQSSNNLSHIITAMLTVKL